MLGKIENKKKNDFLIFSLISPSSKKMTELNCNSPPFVSMYSQSVPPLTTELYFGQKESFNFRQPPPALFPFYDISSHPLYQIPVDDFYSGSSHTHYNAIDDLNPSKLQRYMMAYDE